MLQTRLMSIGTCWFAHAILLTVYLFLGMEIIGAITYWITCFESVLPEQFK